ncbi:MAG: radical SAM protein [Acidiferrobacteraceae bacterium]
MTNEWLDVIQRVDAIADLAVEPQLVGEMQRRRALGEPPPVHFYTPTFKTYHNLELTDCGRSAWPAVSITGGNCKLQCDHCKAKILEPMIPATTPEVLWNTVSGLVASGAGGMLLTGGSNHRDEVEYGPFYSTIRRIKDQFPAFRIAMHTALVDRATARQMADAGIDAAMMDVIGAQDTITQVYHLKRGVDDFERSLEYLNETGMKVVPHIVIGLHYGHLLGEWNALEIVRRQQPDALVLVVVMPMYAPAHRPFVVPNAHEVGQFFLDARQALPEVPILLGCARPPGAIKPLIDAYAVLAGINGMAHPSEGMVELAARLGRRVRVTPSCCSIAVGDEVMAVSENGGIDLDLEEIMEHERRARLAHGLGVPVVAGGCASGDCR